MNEYDKTKGKEGSKSQSRSKNKSKSKSRSWSWSQSWRQAEIERQSFLLSVASRRLAWRGFVVDTG